MLDRVKVLAIALVFLAVSPAAAGAATFAASAPSPRDPAVAATLDLANVTAVYDTVAGSFWIDMWVYDTMNSPSGIAGTVYAATPTGACGAEIGTIAHASSGLVTTTVSAPGGPPKPVLSPKTLFANGRFAGEITDSSLVGVTPGCVTVTSSNSSGVVDRLDSIPFAETASPPPRPPFELPTTSNPGTNSFTFTITTTANPLLANWRGVVAIALGEFNHVAKGTVKVLAGKHTLGHKDFRARANRPVIVRVRLNAASRRRLARGGALNVKIVATARVPGTNNTVKQRLTTTIERR